MRSGTRKGGGVGCSRLGTCKREKKPAPAANENETSVENFSEVAAAPTTQQPPSSATKRADEEEKRAAKRAKEAAKRQRKREEEATKAKAAENKGKMPILATTTANSNNNGFEEVAVKPKISPEERERLRKAEAKAAKRLAAILAQRNEERKQALLSGYAEQVARNRAAAAASINPTNKTRRRGREPRIINNPNITFSSTLLGSTLASVANSRRSSVASSAIAAATMPNITSNAATTMPNIASNAAATMPVITSNATATMPIITSNAAATMPNITSNATATMPIITSNAAATMPVISASASAPSGIVFLPISGTAGAGDTMPTLKMVGNKLVIETEEKVIKPMGKPQLQGFMLKMTTELNNLVNSDAVVSRLIINCVDPRVKLWLAAPALRYINVYRFLVKGSTAETLVTENTSLPYNPKADKGTFPFNLSTDIDTTLIINPQLSIHDFEVIRKILITTIITYFDRLLKNPPQPETNAIKAELAAQGYAFDPSNNVIDYQPFPPMPFESPDLLLQYDDKTRRITYGSMFNMRIIPNMLDLKTTVFRLLTRTKEPGSPNFDQSKIKRKPIEVFDISIPTKSYALLPLSWTYTQDNVIFNWPERQYNFIIYGPLAQFIERTYGLFNYYSDASLAALPPDKFKDDRLAKKAKWIRGLVKLKELARKNPYNSLITGLLVPFRYYTINGVTVGSILYEYMKE